MNRHKLAWIQQTSDDADLSTNARTVAAILANAITGTSATASTDWRKVWKASNLPRGAVLDAVAELKTAGHIGHHRSGWNLTDGYPLRLTMAGGPL